MKFLAGLSFAAFLTYLFLVLAGVYGYFANIVSIFQANFRDFTVLLRARLLGLVFFPIGAILGFV